MNLTNHPSNDRINSQQSKKRERSGPLGQVLLSFFTLLVFLLPVIAHAAVQISEIMYDLPGADTGREWIELTNTGTLPVDIATFKLEEGGVNHSLSVVLGSAVLVPGGSVVVADDPIKFKTDWPALASTLFNSTFSLSNTGETLAIKNASSSIEDSVSYTASMGATGDSGSLHRSGNTFIAGLPNPGIFPGEIQAVPKVEKTPPTSSAPVSKSTTSKTKTNSSNNKTSSVPNAQKETLVLGSQSSTAPVIPPIVLWGAALAAIIGLGILGVVYARPGQGASALSTNTTSPSANEFTIIEE